MNKDEVLILKNIRKVAIWLGQKIYAIQHNNKFEVLKVNDENIEKYLTMKNLIDTCENIYLKKEEYQILLNICEGKISKCPLVLMEKLNKEFGCLHRGLYIGYATLLLK